MKEKSKQQDKILISAFIFIPTVHRHCNHLYTQKSTSNNQHHYKHLLCSCCNHFDVKNAYGHNESSPMETFET